MPRTPNSVGPSLDFFLVATAGQQHRHRDFVVVDRQLATLPRTSGPRRPSGEYFAALPIWHSGKKQRLHQPTSQVSIKGAPTFGKATAVCQYRSSTSIDRTLSFKRRSHRGMTGPRRILLAILVAAATPGGRGRENLQELADRSLP